LQFKYFDTIENVKDFALLNSNGGCLLVIGTDDKLYSACSDKNDILIAEALPMMTVSCLKR